MLVAFAGDVGGALGDRDARGLRLGAAVFLDVETDHLPTGGG